MKRLIFGMIMLSGLTFFACTEKPVDLDPNLDLKVPIDNVVADENTSENIIETTDYEVDLYSTGIESISAFNSTLKAGMMNPFLPMFQNLANFKGRYKNGQFPNIRFEATNGTYPLYLVIDYGTGIEMNNGRILSGKITLRISKPPFVSGSERIITFTEFKCDGKTISGTISKVRTTETTKTFSEISDLKITLENGKVITRHEERKKTWTAGGETAFNPADDVIEITGIVQIKDSEGNQYTKRITVPLIRKGTCLFLVKGIIELSSKEVIFATINYGDGECDNKATKTTTKDGTVEITLGKK
jgi:hypothetical protein